jgi:hypothetical protein
MYMMEFLKHIQIPSSTIVQLAGDHSGQPDLSGLVVFFDRFFTEMAVRWNIDCLWCTGGGKLNLRLYNKEARQTALRLPTLVPARFHLYLSSDLGSKDILFLLSALPLRNLMIMSLGNKLMDATNIQHIFKMCPQLVEFQIIGDSAPEMFLPLLLPWTELRASSAEGPTNRSTMSAMLPSLRRLHFQEAGFECSIGQGSIEILKDVLIEQYKSTGIMLGVNLQDNHNLDEDAVTDLRLIAGHSEVKWDETGVMDDESEETDSEDVVNRGGSPSLEELCVSKAVHCFKANT